MQIKLEGGGIRFFFECWKSHIKGRSTDCGKYLLLFFSSDRIAAEHLPARTQQAIIKPFLSGCQWIAYRYIYSNQYIEIV